MRFWLSWKERSPDYRPLTDPPNEAVLGWWKSGEAGDGSYATLCACVEAPDEEAAQAAVLKSWPPYKKKLVEWRFCEPVADDFTPGDRFPIESGWSKKRFAAKPKR